MSWAFGDWTGEEPETTRWLPGGNTEVQQETSGRRPWGRAKKKKQVWRATRRQPMGRAGLGSGYIRNKAGEEGRTPLETRLDVDSEERTTLGAGLEATADGDPGLEVTLGGGLGTRSWSRQGHRQRLGGEVAGSPTEDQTGLMETLMHWAVESLWCLAAELAGLWLASWGAGSSRDLAIWRRAKWKAGWRLKAKPECRRVASFLDAS